MPQVKYSYGTLEQYNRLSTKDANTLYFIVDQSNSGRVYKGLNLFAGDNLEICTAVPEFATAVQNKLYAVFSGDSVGLYIKGTTIMHNVGGGSVSPGSITTIDAFDDSILATVPGQEDNKIATDKYVLDEIAKAVADYDGAIVDVTAQQKLDKTGTILTFTAKSGGTKDITIADLFLSGASYDASTHILSLTVTGGDTVEVNLEDLVPEVVTTADVALATDIVVTTPVGNFKKGDVISIESTKDLNTLLVDMLSQDSNPVTTQPSVSLLTDPRGKIEVGSVVNVRATATLNAGSYVANGVSQLTGVTASGYVFSDSNGTTLAEQAGNTATFSGITIEDATNYRVSVSATHSAGNVPKTFLGKDYPAGQIAAGTKSNTAAAITGFRKCFYGVLTSKTDAIDNSLIRGLSTATTSSVAKGTKLNISVTAGCSRIVLAYPASVGLVGSILSVEEFGSEIKDSFTLYKVQVEGANPGYAIEYNVYVKDLATPQAAATTYNVTI